MVLKRESKLIDKNIYLTVSEEHLSNYIVVAFTSKINGKDPYKYFEDDFENKGIFAYYVFSTVEELVDKWEEICKNPDGMWCWVLDHGDLITSGGCREDDLDIFEDWWEDDFPNIFNEEDFEFYSDEHVENLQRYIEENFTLDGTSKHLIRNILEYVAMEDEDGEYVLNLLEQLLDCIGIKREEIIKAVKED